MGTLYDQPHRNYRGIEAEHDLDVVLKEMIRLSKEYGVSVTDVIALANVMELKRRNSLFVDNGNIFDEQMAGIGHILDSISSAIESLNNP